MSQPPHAQFSNILRSFWRNTRRIFQVFNPLGKFLRQGLFSLWQILRKNLTQSPEKAIAFLFLSLCILTILAYFFPGSQPFEGNLIVQEVSFTYNGIHHQTFLASINQLQALDLEGRQPDNIVLTGKFTTSDPILNSKLNPLKKITLKLPHPNSRLIFTSLNSSSTPPLDLIDFILFPQTQVHSLSYIPTEQNLFFCLSSPANSSEPQKFSQTCSAEGLMNLENQENQQPFLGKINFQLSQTPIQISLENFNSPELNLTANSDNPNSLDLTFTPTAPQPLQLRLTSPSSLLLTLPELSQDSNRQDWFRGGLKVKDVQFSRLDSTGNVTDELLTSTILEGKIRMAEKEIAVQTNQFLITGKPGIFKLLKIQINPQSPEGLQVRFSGASREIAVGLDPRFPVQKIKPSWLAKYLPPEVINALLSFCAAVVGYLLPYLFTPSPPSNPS